MKQLLSIAALALACLQASAQAPRDELYRALGGQAGIARLNADFVPRLFKNPRIQHFFANASPENLQEQLSAQFCALSGGPCSYEGGDMQAVHADMGITRAHFNTLVEELQAAMDATGIPFATQNRLLALLAPLHRDIVTR
ncbi:group I truncated hemoglobin [Paucibacter soli]|uniref:group I truncated hemoglobin n=1 Tax=Paucibacter soli TaxID=3133433 RepID=UPI00309FB42D